MLLEGMEISDELYVKMFISKLRLTYEYKDPLTKKKELKAAAQRKVKIQQRLTDIEKELTDESIKPKQLKTLKAEEESLKEEKSEMEAD